MYDIIFYHSKKFRSVFAQNDQIWVPDTPQHTCADIDLVKLFFYHNSTEDVKIKY